MDPNPEATPSVRSATEPGQDGQQPLTMTTVLDLQTRFLFPFFFEPNTVKRAPSR